MTIQDNIIQQRKKQGWTQEQAAEKLNISTSSYQRIEQGKTRISLQQLDALANLFDLDIIKLLGNNVSISSNHDNHAQSNHAQTQNNYYGDEALAAEIDKLKQAQEYSNILITQLQAENAFLKKMLLSLKADKG